MTDTAPDTYLETRDVPVADLHHYPGNANQGDVPAIRASIRKTGQYRALIVRQQDDGRLVVLAGNNTLDALRAEGRGSVRCEIHVCDDQTALRINVGDNQIARKAVVDEDALLEQLSFLEGDYEGTGFTEGEVMHLIGPNGRSDDGHETSGLVPDDDDDDEDPAPKPAKIAPTEFPAYDDDLATDYCCPRCDFEWSGKPK